MTYLLVLTKIVEVGSTLAATLSLCLVIFVLRSPQCVLPSCVWVLLSSIGGIVASSQVRDKTLTRNAF